MNIEMPRKNLISPPPLPSMGRGRFVVRYVEKGSTLDTPVRTKLTTLRVTSVSPFTFAVAANKPFEGQRIGNA